MLSMCLFVSEYEYCSNRGSCDFTSGNCLCATGYGGIACDTAHTTYLTAPNARAFQEVINQSIDHSLYLYLPFLPSFRRASLTIALFVNSRLR
jgi:hypothetical protein